MLPKRFQRDDFNMLYDYLWRDKHLAEHTAIHGKNKATREAAAEDVRTLSAVIRYMEIIERDNLTFSDGKIYRDGTEVR